MLKSEFDMIDPGSLTQLPVHYVVLDTDVTKIQILTRMLEAFYRLVQPHNHRQNLMTISGRSRNLARGFHSRLIRIASISKRRKILRPCPLSQPAHFVDGANDLEGTERLIIANMARVRAVFSFFSALPATFPRDDQVKKLGTRQGGFFELLYNVAVSAY